MTMSIFAPAPASWTHRMLAVLRIVSGLMFMSAGTMKLFGFPPPPAPGMPPIELLSEVGVAGVLETFGGLAIVLGLLTRPVAFVLAGEMAVAYFQFHFPQSLFPTTSNGVPAVLYCFVFLYLTAAGAGAWSVDGVIARSRRGERAREGSAVERHRAATLDT
jgi:putative oxidoreductase